MSVFSQLLESTTQRVQKYGAQYKTFAVFGSINYPLALFYEIHAAVNVSNADLVGWVLRCLATILSIGLLLKGYWPQKLTKFLPLYWYGTLLFSIPILIDYMVCKENFSLPWLMNANIGVLILVMLVDYIAFIVLECIGLALALIIFIICCELPNSWPNDDNLMLSLYVFGCIVILGPLFSRNKEKWNDIINKAKQDSLDQLELLVDERTAKLQEALSDKTEFFNNMNHEIRTSIHGINGVSTGLVTHWNVLENKQKFQFANQIATSSQRLYSLLCNLLDWSKFVADKIVFKYEEEANFNDIVTSVITECEALYAYKPIKIEFIKSEPISLVIDKEQIRQAIQNLLINAIKFTPHVGVITVKTSYPEVQYNNSNNKLETLLFSISDTGIGIPTEDLEKIFMPFIQSNRTMMENTGTGLGLSICKKIIEMHRGKIWAENNAEGGATFSFLIPIYKRTIVNNNFVIKNEGGDLPQKQYTVLVIDDEDACLLNMEMMLLDSEYSLVKANSGYSGLQHLQTNGNAIDIVILDLMLPDIYGLDVLAEIKKNAATSNIPVIIHTGALHDAAINQSYAMGVVSYITKPYTREVLMLELQTICNYSRSFSAFSHKSKVIPKRR